MMVFRMLFLLNFFTALFSCTEKNVNNLPSPAVAKRRLFYIKNIEYVSSNNSFEYYGKACAPFLEVTLKNVSNFDLDVHCTKAYPLRLWACDEYTNYPSSGTCMLDFVDTSRLIKKNEEFKVYVGELMSLEQFYAYEFQGVKFEIIISSFNDLSFYFEDNPNKPWFNMSDKFNQKKYGYPFEFIYWVTNDIFWEHYLLEHPPRFYWQHSTDDGK